MPAWHQLRAQSPERFRRRFRRRLLARSPRPAVDAWCSPTRRSTGCRRTSVARLRDFVDEPRRKVRLVVYLRRQDEHLSQRLPAARQDRRDRRLAEWAADRPLVDLRLRAPARPVGGRRWRPPTSSYDGSSASAFTDGSLEADFLDAAGIDRDTARTVPRANESLDAETVEFLRVLNIYLVAHAGETAGLIDHRELVRTAPEHGTGPTLTLPDRRPRAVPGAVGDLERRGRVEVLRRDGAVPAAARTATTDGAAPRPGPGRPLPGDRRAAAHRSRRGARGSPSPRHPSGLDDQRLDGRADLGRQRRHRPRGVGVVDVDVDEAALGRGQRAVTVGSPWKIPTR